MTVGGVTGSSPSMGVGALGDGGGAGNNSGATGKASPEGEVLANGMAKMMVSMMQSQQTIMKAGLNVEKEAMDEGSK